MRLQNCEKLLLASLCLCVRLSVCTEQVGSHWTDFHGTPYLSIFRSSVHKIQVSLLSDKNNGYFTWRQIYICDHISHSSSYREKYFRHTLYRKLGYKCYDTLLFLNRAICEIMDIFFSCKWVNTRWQQYSAHSNKNKLHKTTELTTLVGRLSGIRTQSG